MVRRGKSRKKKLDRLGRVMSKVARGEKLTKADRKVLSGAIDGAKKARSEYPYRYKKKKKIGFARLPKKERVKIARKGGLARWGKLKKR